MVKAGEIRLGNWFILNGRPQRLNSDELWGIAERNTEGTIDEQMEAEVEWLDPIPLTPELLEKAGLKMEVYGHNGDRDVAMARLPNADIHVTDEMVVWVNNEPVPHIKYLHTLQNLYFALTGNELTVTP